MITKIITKQEIEQAVAWLKSGEVVAIPTETVYGLAADFQNEAAVKKIFEAKGRPLNHPLIVHAASLDMVSDIVNIIPEHAIKLAKQFWPGPLTMVLKKKKNITNIVTAGLDTIAVRIPNHPIMLEVIKKLNSGLAAPSANAHKRTSPTQAEHVYKTLSGKIIGIIDGGSCSVGLESTIIDLSKQAPTILRPGSITATMIEEVLQIKVNQPKAHKEKVAGNMEVHYQPEKPLYLKSKKEIEKIIQEEKNITIMAYSSFDKNDFIELYPMPKEKKEYAKQLYQALYDIDKSNTEKIIVESPPENEDWMDIYDRLLKAASN